MDLTEAIVFLKKSDPVIGALFGTVTPSVVRPHRRYFQSLAQAIIGQQLSGKAATTIINRFKALFPETKFPTPAQVLAKSDDELRAAGLSGSKVSYIKNIARAIEDKSLDFRRINKMADEEIITMLTAVKGIGRWTAEMFLIFSLGRPDVFSFGDLGLRNAVKKLYGLRQDPTLKQLKKLSARWQPHRTTASLHLWASLDNR